MDDAHELGGTYNGFMAPTMVETTTGFLMAEMVVEGSTQRKPTIAPFDSFLNEVLKKLAFSSRYT